MSNAAYVLVVNCKIDNEQKRIMFDYIEDMQTTLTSDITSHPMVNGDIVADHMFKNPLSVTFSGKFSLYGNKRTEFGNENRLEEIQSLFERIKNEAILCELSIETINGQGINRFKKRNNMVLTSITWKEHQTDVDFDFIFTEVLLIKISGLEYNKDISDEYLPTLVTPTELNFTDVLINFNEIDKYIIHQMTKVGLLEDGFLDLAITSGLSIIANNTNSANSNKNYSILKSLQSTTIATGEIKEYLLPAATTLFALSFFGPITSFIGGLYVKGKLKKEKEQKNLIIEQFKLYNDDKKNRAEITRFTNFLGTIHKVLNEFNDVVKIYAFPANQEQECSIYIDNSYYTFTITQNQIGGNNISRPLNGISSDIQRITETGGGSPIWMLKTTVLSETGEKIVASNINIQQVAKLSFETCNETNYIFKTEESEKFVYVISLAGSQLNSNISEEEYNEIINKVFNYAILVSDFNPKEYNEKLTSALSKALSL